MKKRISAILLSLAMLCALIPAASASSGGQSVDVGKLPESLNHFLYFVYAWDHHYSGYDSHYVAPMMEYDATKGLSGEGNIMAIIVNSQAPCVDFDIYPGGGYTTTYNGDGSDPKGLYPFPVEGWKAYDGPAVDWVMKNIFNVSEADMAAMIALNEAAGIFYKYPTANGSYQYITESSGIGDRISKSLKSCIASNAISEAHPIR